MTPAEIIQEWAKGCSCSMGGDPSDCEVCTAGMLRALRVQGVDLMVKLAKAEAAAAPIAAGGRTIGIDMASGSDAAVLAQYRIVQWTQPGTITHITPPRAGLSAMRCDGSNGYAGWNVVDMATGTRIENVLWVDPDLKTFCTIDLPPRLKDNEIASTTNTADEIICDFSAMTFWVRRSAVTVAPLSPGRQQDQQPTGRACADCCQEESCRRINYCAAHRGPFGEAAP